MTEEQDLFKKILEEDFKYWKAYGDEVRKLLKPVPRPNVVLMDKNIPRWKRLFIKWKVKRKIKRGLP